MFAGVLLVQAFYQISCRHIENQQPEDSVSNEGIQHQLQDLLIPLFQPNDEENGNVLNILPYADRKRLKGKQDTPMTIILTTNLSKKEKKKGKKDVVIAVQTLNSFGPPLTGIESLLNLSKLNMTESVENSESVPSTAEIINDGTSKRLENDDIAHVENAEDKSTETLQKHNTIKRLHHAKLNDKNEKNSKPPETVKNIRKNDMQHIHRKHQKPKHIEINTVTATDLPSTVEQLSTEEQLSRDGLPAELRSSVQHDSTSDQVSSAEQPDTMGQLNTVEQSSTAEELSPMEGPSVIDESSNIEHSSIAEKTNTAEELSTIEQHNISEELSTVDQPSTEEQLNVAEHQTTTEQPSTAEQHSSSEQLSTAEQTGTVEQYSTAEQPGTTSKSNTKDHQSTANEHSTKEQPSSREEHNTAQPPNTAHQASNLGQSSTAEQTATAEALTMAELINIAEQIISKGKNINIRPPKWQNSDTVNQSTAEDSIISENSVKNEGSNSENLNLEDQTAEKHHTGEITVPWGRMATSEETTDEKQATLISEVTSEVKSDVPSEVTVNHLSTTDVTKHTPRTEKKYLHRGSSRELITLNPIKVEETTAEKPVTSEVTQEQIELVNDDITLEQYVLENEPVIPIYTGKETGKVSLEYGTEEEPRELITLEYSPELELIDGDTLREQYNLENNSEIDENTRKEQVVENTDDREGRNTADTSDNSITSEEKTTTYSTKKRLKSISLSVEAPTAETPVTSEVTLEEFELINGDSMLESGLVTTHDRTEEELEGSSEEPSMSKISITKKTHRKGKKKRRKPKPVEEPTAEISVASEVTAEQLGLMNSDLMVKQFILENSPLIGEEIGADFIREDPQENYVEEIIPNISTIRDYDTYDNPIAERAALSEAETSNILSVLHQQAEINSLLNAQNDDERLNSKTEPLVIVVPNLDKSVLCPDKEKISHSEEKRLREEDVKKRLNWDSNEIPLDVTNRDRVEKDTLNNKKTTRNALSPENDVRQDNLKEIISRYDHNHNLENRGGNGYSYVEPEERLSNQEISHIAGERLTNINDNDTKKLEDNKQVVKSYNLSFTFNKK